MTQRQNSTFVRVFFQSWDKLHVLSCTLRRSADRMALQGAVLRTCMCDQEGRGGSAT